MWESRLRGQRAKFPTLFTTKTTGRGTGLGLSRSYDIGESTWGIEGGPKCEGRGTEFMIFWLARL